MKYLKSVMVVLSMFILAMAFAQLGFAEGDVVDPTITPTMTLTCQYPIEREDGTAIAIYELHE